jgi:hypothetical protein
VVHACRDFVKLLATISVAMHCPGKGRGLSRECR